MGYKCSINGHAPRNSADAFPSDGNANPISIILTTLEYAFTALSKTPSTRKNPFTVASCRPVSTPVLRIFLAIQQECRAPALIFEEVCFAVYMVNM
jgi:hypothetical protein